MGGVRRFLRIVLALASLRDLDAVLAPLGCFLIVALAVMDGRPYQVQARGLGAVRGAEQPQSPYRYTFQPDDAGGDPWEVTEVDYYP